MQKGRLAGPALPEMSRPEHRPLPSAKLALTMATRSAQAFRM